MSGFEMILPYLRPIEHLIGNEEVSEIMVNSSGQVFAERVGLIELIPDVLIPERQRQAAVRNIARILGDDISEEKPFARFPVARRIACGGSVWADQRGRNYPLHPQISLEAIHCGRDGPHGIVVYFGS